MQKPLLLGKCRQLGKLAESLAAAAAFALYLYPLWTRALIFVFQVRDVSRALELLHGHPIFFGPEATSGGHIPGGFYYYLLAIPLGLGLGWKGTWLLLVMFQGLAAGIVWFFFRAARGGFLPALFAVLAFASAYPISTGILVIANSSFVFPFAACVLASLAVAYSPEYSALNRRRALCLAFFMLALGLQLHLSLLALLPAVLALQLLAGRGSRFSARAFFLSALFLFPLLPYALWRLAGDYGWHFGQQPPRFAGVKALGNFLLTPYGNTTYITFEANRTFGIWFAVKQLLLQLHEFVFDLGALTLAGYLVIVLWLLHEAKNFLRGRQEPGAAPVRVLFVCWLFAFFPGLLGVGTGGAGIRYSGLSSIAHVFFTAAALERLLAHFRARSSQLPLRLRQAAAVAVLCSAPLYVARYGARSERVEGRFASIPGVEMMPAAAEVESLAREVFSRTHWSYAKFRERAFFVNVFNELSIQENYEEVAKGPGAEADAPGGFFLARRRSEQEFTESARDPKQWLLSQRLPEPVAEGLKSGGIVLGEAKSFGSLLLVPYQVLERFRYPAVFQNRSEHYENREEERIDAVLEEQKAQPGQLRAAVFYGCDRQDGSCRIALVARSRNLSDPVQPLEVEVLGLPLSLPTMHINPAWTQSIHEPFVAYRCAGSRDQKKEVLAGIVGYDPADSWVLNHSFLAPYRRTLALHCSGGRVEELRLGFVSGTVTDQLGETTLAGQEQVFLLPQ